MGDAKPSPSVPIEVPQVPRFSELQLQLTESRRQWSDLPTEILNLFLDRLTFTDHANFSAVCRSWSSAAAEHHHRRALGLPWLLLSQDPGTFTWGFFSPSEGQVHNLSLPVADGGRCLGSSNGWLIMTDSVIGNHLLNPFTGAQIRLPRASTLEDDMINDVHIPFYGDLVHSSKYFLKAILSSSPTAKKGTTKKGKAPINCVVVAICRFDRRLVFCRPGDDAWSVLREASSESNQDVVFHKGRLHCINRRYELKVFELGRQPSISKTYTPTLRGLDRPDSGAMTLYLVVPPRGTLLMVRRHLTYPGDGARTISFDVFRLVENGAYWRRLRSLRDDMLFLGTGCSRCFRAGADTFGFRPNCIYFTDDQSKDLVSPVMDWGVFCLEDGSIQPFYPDGSQSSKCPPLWFTLNAAG